MEDRFLSEEQTQSNQNRIGLPVKDGAIEYFEFKSIVYCMSDNVYITFYFTKDCSHSAIVIKEGIGKLEKLLPANQFLRIHNRYIVNLMHVKKIYKKNNAHLIMSDDNQIPVSREHRQTLLHALSWY